MTPTRFAPDRIALAAVAGALALVPLALGGSDHYLRIATLMLIYMGYAVAFNIIFGHTRQLFLCLGALAGTAAYFAVVLVIKFKLSPWLTMPTRKPAASNTRPRIAMAKLGWSM